MRYRMLATYRGVPYEAGVGPSGADVVLFAACPPPEELGFEPATGHWRKKVIRAEIDALWESRPVGTFGGEPCIVLDDLGDRLHIAYLGSNPRNATRLGYWQIDRGVFELLTPREDVTGLTEERVDRPLRMAPPLAEPDARPAPDAGHSAGPAGFPAAPDLPVRDVLRSPAAPDRPAPQALHAEPSPPDPLSGPGAPGPQDEAEDLATPMSPDWPSRQPAQRGPAGPGPADLGPGDTGRAAPGPAESRPAASGPAASGPVPPDRAGPLPVRPGGTAGRAPSESVLPGGTGSEPTSAARPLPDPPLPDPALPEQALPEQALPEQALPEQALPEPPRPEGAAPPERAPAEPPLPERPLPERPLPQRAQAGPPPADSAPAMPAPHEPSRPEPALPEPALPEPSLPPPLSREPTRPQPWLPGRPSPDPALPEPSPRVPALPEPGLAEPSLLAAAPPTTPGASEPGAPEPGPVQADSVQADSVQADSVQAGPVQAGPVQAGSVDPTQPLADRRPPPPIQPPPAQQAPSQPPPAQQAPSHPPPAQQAPSQQTVSQHVPSRPVPAQRASASQEMPRLDAAQPGPARHESARPGRRPKTTENGSRTSRRQRVATRDVFCDLADLAGIPRAAYALEAEVDGVLCLLPTARGYEVFVSADGARHEVRSFPDEEAAYFYLFGVLVAEAIRNGALTPAVTQDSSG